MNPSASRTLRFCGLFVLLIAAQLLVFEILPEVFSLYHLYPVSWLASHSLNLLGTHAILITSELADGYCRLELSGIQYAITHECTGILAVFVLTAAVLAYPADLRVRGRGLLLALLLSPSSGSCVSSFSASSPERVQIGSSFFTST